MCTKINALGDVPYKLGSIKVSIAFSFQMNTLKIMITSLHPTPNLSQCGDWNCRLRNFVK